MPEPKVDQGPDPHPACPRCNYFARTQPARDQRRRSWPNPYPPLDQHRVDRVLTAAFPQKSRRNE